MDARAVFISSRSLSFYSAASQQIIYHDWSTRDWRRSRCGEGLEDSTGRPRGVWIRRDTADLIANPCRRCWKVS